MALSIAMVGNRDQLEEWWKPLLQAGFEVDLGSDVAPADLEALSLADQFARVKKQAAAVFVMPSAVSPAQSSESLDESLLIIFYRDPWHSRGTPSHDFALEVAATLSQRGLRMWQPPADG